eukprot:gb/GEZN01009006.1/.p1 GENE.gb/GEZN01009006.1/~~gb/GEZN01009006.1/.p1  ORF type:complete len:309 (-),score=37.45 gb/GEZN01009006.1/:337-1263(-)
MGSFICTGCCGSLQKAEISPSRDFSDSEVRMLRMKILALLRESPQYEPMADDDNAMLIFFFYLMDKYLTEIKKKRVAYKMDDWLVIDWVVNISINKDFFGEGLTNRNNNSILTSALLLTISAPSFMVPPQGDMGFDDIEDVNFRIWMYLMAGSSLCFLFSILLGVIFDSSVARAYTQEDRYMIIMPLYGVFGSVMWLMFIGVLLLILSFGFLAGSFMTKVDVIVISCIALIFVAVYVKIATWAGGLPDTRQKALTNFFKDTFFSENLEFDYKLCEKIVDAQLTLDDITDVGRFWWMIKLRDSPETKSQ